MSQILSNIEVVLLSIVNERASYAYEIDKTIESRDMRRWIKIGVASIYQVLKRLEDKKLVSSQMEKEGKMPERKRYYITDSGKTALVEASKKLLSNFEWFYLDLNVGLESSDCLTPDEITNCLMQRLAKVKSNIFILREMFLGSKSMTFKEEEVLKALICFREAEERFLLDTIEEINREKADLIPEVPEEFYMFLKNSNQ